MTPEQILMKAKYKGLSNLVLICEAMEEYADSVKVARLNQEQSKHDNGLQPRYIIQDEALNLKELFV